MNSSFAGLGSFGILSLAQIVTLDRNIDYHSKAYFLVGWDQRLWKALQLLLLYNINFESLDQWSRLGDWTFVDHLNSRNL